IRFFFSSRRRHTSSDRDWSSDVCSSDLAACHSFGTGMFQCLYQPGPAHWAMLPSTLEWHAAAALVAVAALAWPWAGLATILMLRSEERRVGKERRRQKVRYMERREEERG